YLLSLAAHLKQTLDKPFFLSLNAEMEDEVDPTAGSGRTPADFRDFYRHVALLLRDNGVDNAVFVLNYIGSTRWAAMPWFQDLYPGGDVVDWIAQDPFAFDFAATPDFARLINQKDGTWPGFYDWAAATFPDKPQMLAEWGVDDAQGDPTLKPSFFSSAAQLVAQFPKLRALVYWNHFGIDPNGSDTAVGTTSVQSTPAVLNSFRQFSNSSIFQSPAECQLRIR
ncbi:MAG TPA: hypothetical protein VIG41_00200, partial [Micrococcaceae bacterium]